MSVVRDSEADPDATGPPPGPFGREADPVGVGPKSRSRPDRRSGFALSAARRRSLLVLVVVAAIGFVAVVVLAPSPTAVSTVGELPSTTTTATPSTSEQQVAAAAEQPAEEQAPAVGGASSERPDGLVEPVGNGIVRPVATAEEWRRAVDQAGPGDVIRLTATIGQPLVYHGNTNGGGGPGASGTPDAPIVITADPGVWIDTGSVSSAQNLAGFNLSYADHVHVVGLSIRNAQYGIRCLQCRGTPERPLRLAHNTVESIGYAGIHVAGDLDTHVPSSDVVVEHNTVSNTGRLTPRFGEGIYIGYGAQEWVDETASVLIRGNEISFTTAEAIDLKPGTRQITVEDNLIHDVAPIDGGAISAHYVHIAPNPDIEGLDSLVIRNNRIWNHNLGGAPGASDAAIWVGHGGVEIVGNSFWGFRLHDNTRAVRIQGRQPFGPHPIVIEDNTFWLQRGWVLSGAPGTPPTVVSSDNRGAQGTDAEIPLTVGDLVGPVPPVGEGGDADAGDGPGSGLIAAP